MTMPSVGQLAPDFSAVIDDGSTLRLKELRGTPVVLFFYPKDDTSG
jgi:thioredoxin-dependent peroxiredoxin